jgi:hypothetical protein
MRGFSPGRRVGRGSFKASLAFRLRFSYSSREEMHMHKIATLCVAALLMMSCVGIDSKLSIRENGSGTLSLSYRVSQDVAQLGLSTAGKPVIPLPLSRSDFERSLSQTNGKVRLTRFDRSENEKDITIKAELSFDSLEALSLVDAFRESDLRPGTDGSHKTLSQVIARASATPLMEESRRMIEALFAGYDLTFTVEAPRPIQSSTLGILSADKKSLTYKTSVKDVLTTKDDLIFSLSW